MSRLRDDYETSRWRKFQRWVDGEVDLLASGIEIQAPREPDGMAEGQQEPEYLVQNPETRQQEPEYPVREPETRLQEEEHPGLKTEGRVRGKAGQDGREDVAPHYFKEGRGIRYFRRFYQVMSVFLCLSIIFVLLWTVSYLPVFGNAGNPDNNEVSARYIERGLQETGAVNIVTGMILDYRAFDTFGESCVLFIASCCVLVLLRIDEEEGKARLSKKETNEKSRARKREKEANDRLYEPKDDIILQKCACVLVPLILVFGIYIVLNGHLSPGGGFSGGAVLGSGLIFYLNAFGFKKTEKFFTEKVYRRLTLCALTFYCMAKSYSFFTGANHLEGGIPLGTPGAILSSGLILPLNICVGLVVACTMYAFYALFRKGGM